MYTPLTRPTTASWRSPTTSTTPGPSSGAGPTTWEPLASGKQSASAAAAVFPWQYESCAYCNVDTDDCLIRCNDCKRWFCNGVESTGSSHIFMHLRRSGHKTVATHPKRKMPPVECYVCGNANVFTMGVVNGEYANVLIILCATTCAEQGKHADVTWNPAQLKPLVRDRAISAVLVQTPPSETQSLDSQPTAETISLLEAYWEACADVDPFDVDAMMAALPEITTKLTFKDTAEYFEKFDNLLTMEKDHALEELERQVSDVTVRWSATKRNTCQAFIPVAELKFKLGANDEVEIRHADSGWQAQGHTVSRGTHVREICVEFSPNVIVPFGFTSGFTAMPGWNTTGFDRMRKALEIFKSPGQVLGDYLERRLLGHRVDDVCFHPEEPIQPQEMQKLNRTQHKAIQYALQRPLALVQGPPGTGKTHTAAAIVFNLAMKHAEPILVCAPSNMATDQLAERVSVTGLKVVRLFAKSKEDISPAVKHLALQHLVKDFLEANGVDPKLNDAKRNRMLKAHAEQQILKTADVIACTCVCADDKRLQSLTCAATLIDECAQATEPECMIPIMRGARHLILVGDHRQLGPVIASRAAATNGLATSLFERLALGHIKPYLLKTQYRMHPELSLLPSRLFYDNRLKNGVTEEERNLNLMNWQYASTPTFFWTIPSSEERSHAFRSFQNSLETTAVRDMVEALLKAGAEPSAIGVITPYDGQRESVLRALNQCRFFPKKHHEAIEVASVDAFQGREKEIIIISCVRANVHGSVGFLTDARRLNVALTRARRALYIIGDHRTLEKRYPWNAVVQAYKEDNLLYAGIITHLSPLPWQR